LRCATAFYDEGKYELGVKKDEIMDKTLDNRK